MNDSQMESSRTTRRRSRSRAIAIAFALVLMSIGAAPANASHRACEDYPRCSTILHSGRVVFAIGYDARQARYARSQFNYGYSAGSQAGWRNGYSDGRYRRVVRPQPRIGCRGRSSHYVRGYRQGYAQAYYQGYEQARRERWQPVVRWCR